MGIQTKKRRFTLIELLMVITILAILFAILLPTLYRVREKTNRVICLNNFKQYYSGVLLMAKDNDGYLMDGSVGSNTIHWLGSKAYTPLKEYLVDLSVTDCPNYNYDSTFVSVTVTVANCC